MTRYKTSFIYSILIHFVIILFLFLIRIEPQKTVRSIHFEMMSKVPPKPIEEEINKPEKTQSKNIQKHDIVTTEIIPLIEIQSAEHSISIYDEHAWEQFVKNKNDFLSQNVSMIEEDSVFDSFNTNMQTALLKLLKDTQPEEDAIEKQIQKRNMGSDIHTLPLADIIKALPKPKKKAKPPQFDFIPSEAQIQAMAFLFDKLNANQIELYTQLSTEKPITAEGFDRSLAFLTQKGFVSRKKISPELIFTLQGIPIEMSAKNRKNPLYEYSPRINRKKLITFLESRCFSLKQHLNHSPKDSVHTRSQIQNLEKKIQILIND